MEYSDYSPTNAGYGAVARLEQPKQPTQPTMVYSLWGPKTVIKPLTASTAGAGAGAAHADDSTSVDGGAPAKKRRMRRKVILLMAYSGTGYVGMQRNPGVITIEELLLKALLDADAISQENFEQPQSMAFQRTARTDKGVHAAGSTSGLAKDGRWRKHALDNHLKGPLEMSTGEPPLVPNAEVRSICADVIISQAVDDPDVLAKINAGLPDQVKVFWMCRVTKSFNCKLQCSGRRYEYLTPTYAFAPKGKLSDASAYRMSPETLQRLRHVLGKYKGTHNFHNFTSKREYSNKSGQQGGAQRYIISMVSSDPYIQDGTYGNPTLGNHTLGNQMNAVESNDRQHRLELVKIAVVGQSFVLHQIRKMVGLAMAVVRGYATEAMMDASFDRGKVFVPRAPGLGLMLDQVYFDVYNKKFRKSADHTQLEFSAFDEKIEGFKAKYIHRDMIKVEREEKVILEWLNSLNEADFLEAPGSTWKRQQALDGKGKDSSSSSSAGSSSSSGGGGGGGAAAAAAAAPAAPAATDSNASVGDGTLTEPEEQKLNGIPYWDARGLTEKAAPSDGQDNAQSPPVSSSRSSKRKAKSNARGHFSFKKAKNECWNFQKGKCDRGDECKFSHAPRGEAAAGAPAEKGADVEMESKSL